MRGGRASSTAQWVAFARGLAHHESPPIATDPMARALLDPPWSTVLALADAAPPLARFATWAGDVASRGRSRFMSYRTRVLDDVVRGAVSEGVTQLLILGAGLDARAWRLAELAAVDVFEVDHPSTQALKQAKLRGQPTLAASVRFVGVDFEKDSLAEALQAAGFRTHARTVVLWEGVVMYLPSEAIDATLGVLRALLAPGSVVGISYSRRGSATARAERALVGMVVGAAGESFRHREDPHEMRARIERAGLAVEWDEGHPDWAPRLLNRPQPWDLQRVVLVRQPEPR